MCGIGGAYALDTAPVGHLERALRAINHLQAHRGPDGHGIWSHRTAAVGFAHRRLSIIDIEHGAQPMNDAAGNVVTFNGEIYNYLELQDELGSSEFRTDSDTEVILAAYRRWGADCVTRFRGMFAFALWDEAQGRLFCARDRFGIKPFYYTITDGVLYFASEVKALLPFVRAIETDVEGLKDYLTFQFCLSGKTLFKGISELPAGHVLIATAAGLQVTRYWEVYYNIDFNHTSRYFEERIREQLEDSVRVHLRSDVPVGAYVSGGLDSSAVAGLAARQEPRGLIGFTGTYALGPEYDESHYARELAAHVGIELLETQITAGDFVEHVRSVIYHLDQPVAGPGSFSQYMVSALAAKHRKVVLGGQGGDEIFGGYTRYLIAYFEQVIKAAINGTSQNGHFVVTYESIIPNLVALRGYAPMLQEFWREGLFEPMDKRYFRLINRAPQLSDEVRWQELGDYSPYDTFRVAFNSENVGKESYFDLMTHFDFKTLLPALLQVEDRVSMAHGLEARVPLLDHALVESAATIPSDIKFESGRMKHLFRSVVSPILPASIPARTDKMGFPTPIAEWVSGEARDFVTAVLTTSAARSRALIDNTAVVRKLTHEPKFGRRVWALLSLELWQQEFHDRQAHFRALGSEIPHDAAVLDLDRGGQRLAVEGTT
jgi:asparagine synthase (glutamine-hydrolysing)